MPDMPARNGALLPASGFEVMAREEPNKKAAHHLVGRSVWLEPNLESRFYDRRRIHSAPITPEPSSSMDDGSGM